MNKQNIFLAGFFGVIGVVVIFAFASVISSSLMQQPVQHSKQQGPSLAASLQQQLDSIPTQAGKANFLKQSNHLTKSVDPELVDLDSQIITCGANIDSLLSDTPSFAGSCIASGGTLQNTTGMFLGGQCCGTLMNTKEYHEHLQELQAYKDIPDIPLDPYHTPIDMAKRWIKYDKNTTLTPDEQKIYDEAYAMSKEKPCCCKCWHYYVNEGIAKEMIKVYHYTPKQIADFWDASDICGT